MVCLVAVDWQNTCPRRWGSGGRFFARLDSLALTGSGKLDDRGVLAASLLRSKPPLWLASSSRKLLASRRRSSVGASSAAQYTVCNSLQPYGVLISGWL